MSEIPLSTPHRRRIEALFRAAVAYAEAKCDAARVVPALYGAVELDAQLEPFDRNLWAFGKRDREGWGCEWSRR